MLGFVIAQKLFEKFPDASEGVLSRLRANLVNQGSLAEVCARPRYWQLLNFRFRGVKKWRISAVIQYLSDALEAIMGAVVMDQGITVCRDWVSKLFANKIASTYPWMIGKKILKPDYKNCCNPENWDLPEISPYYR